MICQICNTEHYHQTEWEPEESCICGHGIYGESAWHYAGWRGVLAKTKYTYVRKAYEKMHELVFVPIGDWLYKPWDY